MKINHVYQEDCLKGMRKLKDNSVDCCITSPPYWGLRQYLFDGAARIKSGLSEEDRKYVESELKKHEIKPKI